MRPVFHCPNCGTTYADSVLRDNHAAGCSKPLTIDSAPRIAASTEAKPVSPERQDRLFSYLVDHARQGLRCPCSSGPNADSRMDAAALAALTRSGKIRISIHRWNWRVVTILDGPHAGLSTAPCPKGSKAYRVIGREGDQLNPARFQTRRVAP